MAEHLSVRSATSTAIVSELHCSWPLLSERRQRRLSVDRRHRRRRRRLKTKRRFRGRPSTRLTAPRPRRTRARQLDARAPCQRTTLRLATTTSSPNPSPRWPGSAGRALNLTWTQLSRTWTLWPRGWAARSDIDGGRNLRRWTSEVGATKLRMTARRQPRLRHRPGQSPNYSMVRKLCRRTWHNLTTS